MAAWRYEISPLVLKKYFTRSLRSLMKYFSTPEEKFCTSSRPCNILYELNDFIRMISGLDDLLPRFHLLPFAIKDSHYYNYY